jgi:hypothetical protein
MATTSAEIEGGKQQEGGNDRVKPSEVQVWWTRD